MIRPALASNSLVMPRLVKEVNSLSQRLGAKPSLNFVIISEFIWREESMLYQLLQERYELNNYEKKNPPVHVF